MLSSEVTHSWKSLILSLKINQEIAATWATSHMTNLTGLKGTTLTAGPTLRTAQDLLNASRNKSTEAWKKFVSASTMIRGHSLRNGIDRRSQPVWKGPTHRLKWFSKDPFIKNSKTWKSSKKTLIWRIARLARLILSYFNLSEDFQFQSKLLINFSNLQ